MKYLRSVCTSESGAVAVIYAIIFPVLLAFVAFALDGSLLLNRKARLADAASEAILAISAIDNRLVNQSAVAVNKNIAAEYINYYLPEHRRQALSLAVSMEDRVDDRGYVDYSLVATATLPTLLPLKGMGFSTFGKTVDVSNQGDNSGNARKFITTNASPADIVFVVDFSDTMNTPYTDGHGMATTRLGMLKKVVHDVIEGNKNTKSQFSIVPFDLGVPFKMEHAVNAALPYKHARNEAGGELIGCSALYVPRQTFSAERIDYAFWANKNIIQNEYNDIKNSRNLIFYNLDRARYLYYRFIVGKALKEDIGGLERRGWCEQNSESNPMTGFYAFSCEKEAGQSIFSAANRAKIETQYNQVVALLATLRGKASLERASIANSLTIDYDRTLADDNLFSNHNVQEFIQPWAPNMYEYRAFPGMCQSATPLRTVSQALSQQQAAEQMGTMLAQSKANTFLIPLTDNDKAKNRLIADFAAMTAGGGTDSSSGLLRSVPVIAQGTNPKKVIIVISDGEDEVDPAIVSAELHSRGMCDVIKSGLKSERLYAKKKIAAIAEKVEIHYVSINDDETNAERTAFWGKYCAKGDDETDGTQYVHTATDYASLITTLKSIVGVETGYYIRNDQK